MTQLGFVALVLAFILAIYGAVAAVIGGRRRYSELVVSARNASLAMAALITIATAALVYAFMTDDLQVEYVARNSSRSLPFIYKLTALWGGQAGSLLFWSWILAMYGTAVTLKKWRRNRELMPYVAAVILGIQVFFLGMTVFVSNPFSRLSFVPAEGLSLNPLLQNAFMALHPPMLYLGYVGFTIPFAFAIAALITRRTGNTWIRTTRRWTLIAWLFLSCGLLLGGRWAYEVLGWGGYWGWDPVENAAFMPWLTGTAFLHSVIIQEKRGMLKKWNMVLIILTFNLVLFGTFLTRSGMISSVHSFAQSNIGPLFLGFISVVLIGTMLLLFDRMDTLESENEMDSLISRESAFLANNLVFLGICFATFWGTMFPMISEMTIGNKITVGPPYFNQVNGPIFGLLLVLMGIGPMVAWRRSSAQKLLRQLLWPFVGSALIMAGLFVAGVRQPIALIGFGIVAFVTIVHLIEYYDGVKARLRSTDEGLYTALTTLISRSRRRYGGYLVHIGIILMAIGVLGSNVYQQETQQTLAQGESMQVAGYTLTYENLRQNVTANRDVLAADVGVSRGGEQVTTIRPRRDFHRQAEQVMTIPAIRSTPREDLYVLLGGFDMEAGTVTLKVYVNPLVMWLWIGGFVLITATIVAAWPDPAEERAYQVALERRVARLGRA